MSAEAFKNLFGAKKNPCVLISNKNKNLNPLTNNSKFNSYLSGLIEGDGCIHVPKSERSLKGKLN